MSEKHIEREVVSRAKLRGITSIKLNTESGRGWPDRMFLIPGGRPLFIEFKRPGGRVSPRQTMIHDRLQKLGYDVEVHDDVDEAFRSIIINASNSMEAP